MTETQAAVERAREAAAQQLAVEVEAFFEGVKGVERGLETARQTPEGNVFRFRVDAKDVIFDVKGEAGTVETDGPIVLEVSTHENEDGSWRTLKVEQSRMELPPGQAGKFLPRVPEQNWVLHQNDISVTVYRQEGKPYDIEFSRGWNSFVKRTRGDRTSLISNPPRLSPCNR
jgi:hypothetical protein